MKSGACGGGGGCEGVARQYRPHHLRPRHPHQRPAMSPSACSKAIAHSTGGSSPDRENSSVNSAPGTGHLCKEVSKQERCNAARVQLTPSGSDGVHKPVSQQDEVTAALHRSTSVCGRFCVGTWAAKHPKSIRPDHIDMRAVEGSGGRWRGRRAPEGVVRPQVGGRLHPGGVWGLHCHILRGLQHPQQGYVHVPHQQCLSRRSHPAPQARSPGVGALWLGSSAPKEIARFSHRQAKLVREVVL